jgi:hypothetical protein
MTVSSCLHHIDWEDLIHLGFHSVAPIDSHCDCGRQALHVYSTTGPRRWVYLCARGIRAWKNSADIPF